MRRLFEIAARRWSLVALFSVVLACAFLVQGPGSSQNSHYALIRSLSQGTATIDATRHQVGDLSTDDVSYWHGHYYSDKAPGLALVSLPVYAVLEKNGSWNTGDPTRMLWALGLWGTVLPVALLLVLVKWVGERMEPGMGTAAAVTLGLGTLLLPFGTMFFDHALAAFLVFAAFALLFHTRYSGGHLPLVPLAGVAAGYAIGTDYPSAIGAVVLGVYSLSGVEPVRRAAAYAGGLVVGLVPLFAYDWWAWGSPTHLSRVGARINGVPVPDLGFLGAGAPRFRDAVELLFSKWGLLTTSPVLVAAAVGVAILYRRGRRAEALVISAVALLDLAYDSGSVVPFGSAPPGPRYLIPMLPFLGVALAVSYRAFPLPSVALAVASALVMVAFTVTRPLAAWDGHVIDRLTSSGLAGYSSTVPDLVGVTGSYDILLFFPLVGLAGVAAVAASRPTSISARGALSAIVALGLWGIVAVVAQRLLTDNVGGRDGAAALVVFVSAAAVVAVALVLTWEPHLPSPKIGRREAASSSRDGARP